MALIQEFTFVVLTLMTSELWHGRGMSSGRADWFKRRNMNPRHGAALALVGWYLMMPPVNPTTNIEITDAPISKWIIDSSHDSAKDCHGHCEAA